MFEIFRDTDHKYRFRLMGSENRIIAVSDGFEEKRAVVNAISEAREFAATSYIRDYSANDPGPVLV